MPFLNAVAWAEARQKVREGGVVSQARPAFYTVYGQLDNSDIIVYAAAMLYVRMRIDLFVSENLSIFSK